MKLKNIKTSLLLVLFLTSFSSYSIETFQVDCQEYALDMLDVIEGHYGCIEDADTYNQVAQTLVNFCEAMDQ